VIPTRTLNIPLRVAAADDLEPAAPSAYFRDTWKIKADDAAARALIETEAALVDLVDRLASDEDAFETIADAVEGGWVDDIAEVVPGEALPAVVERLEVDGASPTGGLDLGVAGLVLALAAGGYRTEASCRSHAGSRIWSDRPIVYFAAGRDLMRTLVPLVERAGCGLGAGAGVYFVQARSIRDTMRLARLIIEAREV
jgi:hypothetical protein